MQQTQLPPALLGNVLTQESWLRNLRPGSSSEQLALKSGRGAAVKGTLLGPPACLVGEAEEAAVAV